MELFGFVVIIASEFKMQFSFQFSYVLHCKCCLGVCIKSEVKQGQYHLQILDYRSEKDVDVQVVFLHRL